MSEGKPFSEAGRNRREASAAHQDSVIRKWGIYGGTGIPPERPFTAEIWPPPPPWRSFTGGPLNPPPPDDAGDADRRIGPAASGPGHASDPQEVAAVNAAISLRRPLLVTGAPGVGKSSLGYRIARELGLGRVLRWAITSRSTLRLGLYDYDAIGRAQNAGLRARWHQQAGEPVSMDVNESERAAAADIGDYLQLGPLGTALLPYSIPRVLLIDELDKSDIDLPNDLLHVFEEGEYTVRELDRVRALMPVVEVHTDDPGRTAKITEGRVRCRAFPIIVITSNREREFPPAFLRRCLRLEVQPPGREQLASMVAAQFSGDRAGQDTAWLIRDFLERRSRRRGMGADQLLNAVHLATSDAYTADRSWDELLDLVWRHLDETPPA